MNNMKVLHNGSGLDKLIKNSPLSAKAPFIRKHSALAVAACLIFPLNDAIANIEGYNFPFSEAYLVFVDNEQDSHLTQMIRIMFLTEKTAPYFFGQKTAPIL